MGRARLTPQHPPGSRPLSGLREKGRAMAKTMAMARARVGFRVRRSRLVIPMLL